MSKARFFLDRFAELMVAIDISCGGVMRANAAPLADYLIISLIGRSNDKTVS